MMSLQAMNVVILLVNGGDSGGAIYNGFIRLGNGGPDVEFRKRNAGLSRHFAEKLTVMALP
ncbi:MAG: hypothetical protein JWL90_461 [Chthoniobacteraceae bacterium]|nr:hypothetical protein [Chthoniobacteraceae bacterium]